MRKLLGAHACDRTQYLHTILESSCQAKPINIACKAQEGSGTDPLLGELYGCTQLDNPLQPLYQQLRPPPLGDFDLLKSSYTRSRGGGRCSYKQCKLLCVHSISLSTQPTEATKQATSTLCQISQYLPLRRDTA